MNHREKQRIARKMGGFNSEAWQARKNAIAKRVKSKELKASKSV